MTCALLKAIYEFDEEWDDKTITPFTGETNPLLPKAHPFFGCCSSL